MEVEGRARPDRDQRRAAAARHPRQPGAAKARSRGPPSGGQAAAPAASAPAAAEVSARAKVDPELEARRKKAEQEHNEHVKAEEEKVAAQRAENCKRARAHQASLDSGLRLSRINEKGEREILDDKARAEEMARTRQAIATECR